MKIHHKLGVVAGLVAMSAILSQTIFSPVSAAPNDVVINEIMYNYFVDDNSFEYIELYNNTASPIDLEGWCFTDGVSLCFGAGITIGANDYLVVSPSIADTLNHYGVASVAEYSGNLSNGGETVTLEDDTFSVVSTVTYDDSRPWPITPDGEGPSLELNNPLGDTTDPENWGASTTDFSKTPAQAYTPGAENNIYNSGYPIIRNVTDPNDIAASTTVNITAEVEGAGITGVNLIYQTDFDGDAAPIAMLDDGASNDGAAGDGVYGASIPGQTAGTLVRFRVEATNASGTTDSPRYDDTQNYHGYYIAQNVTTNAVLLEWFIDEADYTAMYANSPATDFYPSVVVYGNDVYDGARARLKGEYSLTFPKKSYKMNLPKNYYISIDWDNNDTPTFIDEFHLNSDYTTEGIARAPLAWWITEQTGQPVPDFAVSRLQRNGAFEGQYILIDKYEKEWKETNGYDNGALYEDYAEIEGGTDDYVLFDTWKNDQSLDRNDPNRRNNVLDQNNIPAMFNYMAAQALARSHDHSLYSNTFSYRDNNTERWELLQWDLDLLFNDAQVGVSPYDTVDYIPYTDRFPTIGIYDQPDLREAYMRRLRTLFDKIYAGNEALTYFQSINELHESDSIADVAKWPDADGFLRTPIEFDELIIRKHKNELSALITQPWNGGLPASQTNAERQSVSIAQVVSSANNANEFIRLSNSASTAVDISEWYIEGIEYTIPAGAVIPAGGSIYILRDDIGYRASHDSVLVAGQYETDLSAVPGTNLVLKTDTDMEIDTYDY